MRKITSSSQTIVSFCHSKTVMSCSMCLNFRMPQFALQLSTAIISTVTPLWNKYENFIYISTGLLNMRIWLEKWERRQ